MIIFDLDGTLADCEHRRHFVDAKHIKNLNIIDGITIIFDHKNNCWTDSQSKKFKPDWRSFYESCSDDTPIEPTINIFRQQIFFSKPYDEDLGWEIWSGRCESVKEKTVDWLIKNVSHFFSLKRFVNQIKMRPIGDYTPDNQLKERWLDEFISKGGKIDFVFDDRPKVVAMWRSRGVFVFDCNQSGRSF